MSFVSELKEKVLSGYQVTKDEAMQLWDCDYDELYNKYQIHYWGYYDCLDKILYRDGGGVSLVPVESEYEYFYAEDGTSLSDHASLSAVFDVIKTDDFKESGISLSVTSRNKFEDFIKRIFLIFTDLFKALTHLGDLKNVL